MEDLLSFDGRVGRKPMWMLFLATIPFALLLNLVVIEYDSYGGIEMRNGFMPVVAFVIWLAFAVVSLSFQARRWHDHGKSGWWCLITLVPIVGAFYAFYMVYCKAGDIGPNEYGSAPGAVAPAYGLA